MRNTGKKLLFGAGAGTAGAAAALLLWAAGVLDGLENATWRWRVLWLARESEHTERIKLVLLDQASLDWAREENSLPWPWPREVYQSIIAFCARARARCLVFDVLYTEPSAYGVADDAALGAAIRDGPPFAGALFLGRESGSAAEWPAQMPEPPLVVHGLDAWLRRNDAAAVTRDRALFPIAEVATNAALLGNVSGAPDPDGIFRRETVFGVFDGAAVPSLGLAAYQLDRMPADGAPALEATLTGSALRLGGGRVPLDRKGRAILRFRGEPDVYESFSAAAVIQSELRLQQDGAPVVEPSALRDAVVFFGFSAPGLMDLRPTPVSSVTPGVFVHATLLDNLLALDPLRDAAVAYVAAAALLLALLGGVLITLSRRAWQNVIVFVLVLPLPAFAAVAAYELGLWWPVVMQELAVALALVAGVVINYATEGRQKAFIKQAFRHYLSPAVIDRILLDPSQLKLGGERRELTILFSDIQGFSGISEKLEPQELTSLLNDYLSDMTDIILEQGGTLDKYEGDAIIAFWNAPLGQPDHAVRACRAAVQCQRRLAERRAEFERKAGVELHARIGINTGEVVVGNMGSRERFDYTVLGDAANLASRLEGANKVFGTWIMVSESTWQQAGAEFTGRELGRLRVVGRQAPVSVFEVQGFSGDPRPEFDQAFQAGLRACAGRDWRAAMEQFASAAGHDPVSSKYFERCRRLAGDPSADWDGVWSLTEK